jgi:hypothetical protein
MRHPDDYEAWLTSLQPGDEVAVRRDGWDGTNFTILRIERLTATQFVIADGMYRFRRDTGRIVGQGYHKIHQVTREMRDNIEAARLVAEFQTMFRPSARECVNRIPLAVLRAMAKAYDEASK